MPAGMPDHSGGVLAWRPVYAGWGAGLTHFVDPQKSAILAEKRPENLKSEGKSMEFGHGNARRARSTSLAIDQWIKTYQNAQDSQIDPKANWGYFWWKFSNFSKSKKNLGVLWGKQSQIRGNLGL